MQSRIEKEKQKFVNWIESEDYQERLTNRLKINDACYRNDAAKALTIELCKDPEEGAIFFIENFGWTFDPRPEHWINESGHLPFIMFDYQKEAVSWLVEHITKGEDGLIEKSRDMGMTWLVVWTFVWFWLYAETFNGLVGSYKEALVDNRTKDSLFGMIDYALESLPKWMLPKGWKPKEHRHKLKLVNPENQNLITGDTMNPDFGRGSRKTVVFLDEGASWDYFKDAWESCGDVTPCRLTGSTPKGHNQFAITKESGIDVLTIHWSSHPLKDNDWYEAEKERRTEEEVAQELDISYQKSQEGRVYPEWDNVEKGDYPYDHDLPLFVSWDFGRRDPTAIIWWQPDNDNKVRIVDAYQNSNKLIDFYVPFITGVVPSDEYYKYTKRDLEIIQEHKYWKRGIHFGDPAGRFRNQVTNQTVLSTLKQHGIHVNFREEAKDFQTRKTATKLLLRDVRVNDTDRTKDLSVAMENAAYPKVTRQGKKEIISLKPLHNWTSHFRSAVEYFAVNYNKYSKSRARIRDKFQKSSDTNSRKSLVGY